MSEIGTQTLDVIMPLSKTDPRRARAQNRKEVRKQTAEVPPLDELELALSLLSLLYLEF